MLGQVLLQQGDLDDAIAHFRALVRAPPKLGIAHAYLAQASQTKGLLDEAMLEFRVAVHLAPQQWQAHQALGACTQFAEQDGRSHPPISGSDSTRTPAGRTSRRTWLVICPAVEIRRSGKTNFENAKNSIRNTSPHISISASRSRTKANRKRRKTNCTTRPTGSLRCDGVVLPGYVLWKRNKSRGGLVPSSVPPN